MIIYNYDPITFEYISSEEAGRNPLNPNEPIVPACATIIEPLDAIEKYAIVWIGNKWEYKEDHRGELWYNSISKDMEVIKFIGTLPNYYYAPDSTIANKPDGDYWVYDSDNNTWIGNSLLYKQYVLSIFPNYWSEKQNIPFKFKGFKYIPAWRDLYDSIFNTLNNGIKQEYRLQDYDGKYNTVTLDTMKPIYTKMADIVDEMYVDKQNLESYFKTENDFSKLQNAFDNWVSKIYK